MRLKWEYKHHQQQCDVDSASAAAGGAEAGGKPEGGEGVDGAAWDAHTQALGLEILMNIPTDMIIGEVPGEEEDDEQSAEAELELDDAWVGLSESDADVLFAACVPAPGLEAAVRRDRLRDRMEKAEAAEAGVEAEAGTAVNARVAAAAAEVWMGEELERQELERGVVSVIGSHTRVLFAQPPLPAHQVSGTKWCNELRSIQGLTLFVTLCAWIPSVLSALRSYPYFLHCTTRAHRISITSSTSGWSTHSSSLSTLTVRSLLLSARSSAERHSRYLS
jgi:hypothetical protein